ncbi:hypothetical protein ACFLZX_02100 [Nanoarchaeota archaeon]
MKGYSRLLIFIISCLFLSSCYGNYPIDDFQDSLTEEEPSSDFALIFEGPWYNWIGNLPHGEIWAGECESPQGGCVSNVHWNSHNLNYEYVQIRMKISDRKDKLWACTKSNEKFSRRTWALPSKRTFRLYPARGCDDGDELGRLLDSIEVGEEIGYLFATECIDIPNSEGCKSRIVWGSWNLDYPAVQVRVGNTQFACSASNVFNPASSGWVKTSKDTWDLSGPVTLGLYGASECGNDAEFGPLLDVIMVNEPKFYFSSSDCLDYPRYPGCISKLIWGSANFNYDYILIWEGNQRLSCTPTNIFDPDGVSGSRTSIETSPISRSLKYTFYASDACENITSFDRLKEITIYQRDSIPVCSVTGERFRPTSPDFIGMNGHEIRPSAHWDNMEQLTQYTENANIYFLRKIILWEKYEITQDHYYDIDNPGSQWVGEAYWDWISEDLTANGMNLWITFGKTPQWASTEPDANDLSDSREWMYYNYPPADIEEWREFVAHIVEKLKGKVDNWEPWLEPDTSFKVTRGLYANHDDARHEAFAQMHEVFYDTVHQYDDVDADGDGITARVWGPDVIVGRSRVEPPTSEHFSYDFIDAVLNTNKIDGIAVHIFNPSVEDMIESYRDLKDYIRENFPQHSDLPIAITAAMIIPDDANYNLQYPECPYNNMSESEEAQLVSDIFTCLGNEGVDHVMLYKLSERERLSNHVLGPCPDGVEHSGILSSREIGNHPKNSYYAVQKIGQYAEINR